MKAVIVNFRKSKHRVSSNQLVVKIDGVETKEKAAKLIGKKVVYNTGKKDISGQIVAAHGNKGAVRAAFETGMPGQCLGQSVKIE